MDPFTDGGWAQHIEKYVIVDDVYVYAGARWEGRAHSGSHAVLPTDDPNRTDYTDERTTSTEQTTAVLVTKHGVVSFTPPSEIGQFFAGLEIVPQQFRTTSEAIGAATFGNGAKRLEGLPDIFDEPPPFIGWA
jgi:hypothetical protein